MPILLVEKDMNLSRRVQNVLERSGYACTAVHTIEDAQKARDEVPPDLVILNARMPWAQCHPFMLSLEPIACPILFISHDPQCKDHLLKLYHALADVILRPFDGRQLVAKVEALLQETRERLACGDLSLDLCSKTASMDGKPLELTAQEYALLEALMQSPDTAVSRQDLLKTAWGYLAIGETRTVDVHIQRLRRKLGSERIETVYKMGYRLRLA